MTAQVDKFGVVGDGDDGDDMNKEQPIESHFAVDVQHAHVKTDDDQMPAESEYNELIQSLKVLPLKKLKIQLQAKQGHREGEDKTPKQPSEDSIKQHFVVKNAVYSCIFANYTN